MSDNGTREPNPPQAGAGVRDRSAGGGRASGGWRPFIRRHRVAVLTFAVAVGLGGWVAQHLHGERHREARSAASTQAELRGLALEAELREASGALLAVEALVRSAGGIPAGLDARGEEILARHPTVATLKLQPGGVGARVVPADGNPVALGRDVLEDPATGALSRAIAESGAMGVVAPVELPDGAPGAVLRLPVFFPPQGEGRQFWGFVSADLRLEEALERAGLPELEAMGYRVSLQTIPADSEVRAIAGTDPAEMRDPEVHSVSVPGTAWALALEPTGRWSPLLPAVRDVSLVLLGSLLLAFVVGRLDTLRSLRSQADQAIREEERHRALLLEGLAGVDDGVATLDADLRLEDFNARWAEAWGYPPELVAAGRDRRELIRHGAGRGVHGHGEPEADLEAGLERVRAGKAGAAVTAVLPEGRILEVRWKPLPGRGLVEIVADVSEERWAGAAFRVLSEGSREAHLLVHGERIVDCNGASLEVLGRGDRTEVVGTDLAGALGEGVDLSWVRELLAQALEEGEARGEGVLRRGDGDPVPVELRARRIHPVPGKGGLLVVLRDVREARELEQALRASQGFLQGVLDHHAALVSAKNLEGRYVLVNREWQRVMGISRQGAVGYSDRDLFPAEAASERERVDRRALDEEAPISVEERLWVDGRVRTFQTVAFPIRESGARPEAVCRISADVTAIKELEAEVKALRERAEAFDRVNGGLLVERADAVLGPLDTAAGLVGKALAADPGGGLREPLVELNEVIGGLRGTVVDILDLARLEAGVLELEHVPFHLEEVLEGVAEATCGLLEAEGVELLLRLDPRTPVRVVGDPHRLKQVLCTLVEAGVDPVEGEAVTVAVEPRSTAESGAALRFSVRHQGAWVPRADGADRSMEGRPVPAGGTDPRRDADGTADDLHLAVCRSLVNLMGGRIEAQGGEGTGTHVRFTAELRRDTEAPRRSVDLSGVGGERVLVAAPHAGVRRACLEILERAGLQLEEAEEGEAALEAVRSAAAGPDPFQLVLVDEALQAENGAGVARELVRFRGTSELPLVVVLGRRAGGGAPGREGLEVGEKPDSEALKLGEKPDPEGPEATLPKPVTPTVLLGIIVSLLEEVRSHGEDRPIPAEAAMIAEALAGLVASGDTRAVEVVDRLVAKLAGTPLEERARRIAGFVRGFEFEGARLALKILRESLEAEGEG